MFDRIGVESRLLKTVGIFALLLVIVSHPEMYEKGIDSRWRDRYGVWIVRSESRIVAIMESEPRPWEWPLLRLRLTVDEENQIWVDTGTKFRYEQNEWSHPESFVSFSAETNGEAIQEEGQAH